MSLANFGGSPVLCLIASLRYLFGPSWLDLLLVVSSAFMLFEWQYCVLVGCSCVLAGC